MRKTSEMERYQEELRRLRAQFELREKRIEELEKHLNVLYNSRFIRPAIRFRLFVLPAYTILRRMATRYIPISIRQSVKRILHWQKKPKRKTIVNVAWKPNTPLVTVVTPYYNRAHTIDETVASVFQQTFQDFEYILVDDGSTEAPSIAKLDELAQRWPKLKIIRKQNGGLGPARNTGIAAGTGKYVVCLDSDDQLDPTYIEKCVTVLETNPQVRVVTTHMQFFGLRNDVYKEGPYNPIRLFGVENMLHCASLFVREDWEENGGFKNIGHEDWEFWINLAEHGHFGYRISEPIFHYRKAEQSMFVDELKRTKENVRYIKHIHPDYIKLVKKHLRAHRRFQEVVSLKTAFLNLSRPGQYKKSAKKKKHVLIAIPYMNFGGAETLIYNFTKQLKDDFEISFLTFLPAENEWEKKFQEVSSNIYHLPHLFSDSSLYTAFVANFIETRHVDILHVVHNGHAYEMFPILKRQFPTLAIIVTLFNDRAHFSNLGKFDPYIDVYSADNKKVLQSIRENYGVDDRSLVAIPNGIDCERVYNPQLFDGDKTREVFHIAQNEFVVTFLGRLSHEKKPDAFLAVAEQILRNPSYANIHFLVIGDGPMKNLVERTVAEIGNKNIQYLGYRTPDEIPKLLAITNVLVVPSTIEGSPQTVFEAASMGAVVVASNVGGISEILKDGETGYVVPPASVVDIVSSVQKLYDERALTKTIGANARALMQKNYSLQKLKERYAQLYREA